MKKIITFLLGIISFFSITIYTHADEDKIRIGYIDSNSFIYFDNANYDGYGIEYLKEMSRYTSWGFEDYEYIYNSSWESLLKMLVDGDIDLICQAQKTPEREQVFNYSKFPIGNETSMLYVKSTNNTLFYEDFDAFNNITVAYLNGSFQKEALDDYAKEEGFSYNGLGCDNNQDCFKLLNEDKVDAVAAGSLEIRTGYRSIANYSFDPFYIITGKSERQVNILKEVDNAIFSIKSNTPLFEGELYKEYFKNSSDPNDIAFTKDELDLIKANNPINIALIPNRMPLSYLDENNNPAGIIVDIMNLIAQKTNLNFVYSMLGPGVYSTSYLTENQNNFISGVSNDNKAFDIGYLLSNSYYDCNIAIAGRNDVSYSANASPNSYRLAISKTNQAIISYLEKNNPEFTIVKYNSNEECANAVANKEVDFLAANNEIIKNIIQKPKYKDISIIPIYLTSETMVVAGYENETNKTIISIINKAISTIDSKEIDQIIVNQTILTKYEETFGDFFDQYKVVFIVIIILILLTIASLITAVIISNKAYIKVKKANESLEEAVQTANKANSAKTDFLASISHEIRTPMNAIVGLTNLAKTDVADKNIVADYLNKIDVNSKILLEIINEVLDMSSIEAGKFVLDETEFDFKVLVENASMMFYHQAQAKNINFSCHVYNLTNETLIGDSTRINQIMINILSNAIKYTKENGKVIFDVYEAGVINDNIVIRFVVKDNGIGMSSDLKNRLYKAFERENFKDKNTIKGSGLGLAITKNIVDLMKGTIECESELGVGTTFTIDLPLKISKNKNGATITNFKNIKALIVDDDLESCEYCGSLLERLEVEHDYVTSGIKAIEMMEKANNEGKPYNVCFVDWKMPEINGIDLTKKIRASFKNKISILIVTAYDVNEIELSGKLAGADYYVSKPLFQSTIFNALSKISISKEHNFEKINIQKYDFSGKKILIAEDVKINMEVVARQLQKVNAAVFKTYDGKEALDAYINGPLNYDLILLDINMPLLNGYEVARKIRAAGYSNSKYIPIYAMTANAFSSDVKMALDAGMNGHIAKPINVSILYKTIEQALNINKKENS